MTLSIGNGQLNQMSMSEVSNTLDCMHDKQAIITDCGGGENMEETQYVVRRLTPEECEKLQGYPTCIEPNIKEMTKDEYIAYNLAVGNIIADAETGDVFATRGPGGVKLKEPKKLEGTLIKGYVVYSIRNGDIKLQCKGHRIIWVSANGVVPDGMVIDHINNNKADNRLCNLQLLTPEENSKKAYNDGLYLTGDDNPATKLKVEGRASLIYDYCPGEYTYKTLAEKYGICKSRVHQILNQYGYTNIGSWTDENGKVHKLSDSSRYKALGNSIALPQWRLVLNRMAKYLPEDAKMASLFDGLGGFPLIFQEIFGEGSAVWASEVEPYCIAVTKKHFGDEDAGIEGDFCEIIYGHKADS